MRRKPGFRRKSRKVEWTAVTANGCFLFEVPSNIHVPLALRDWNVEMKGDEEHGAEVGEPPKYIRLSERFRIEGQAYASSPSAHLANWRAPTLFTFGDLDTLGHAESVIDLGHRLLECGVPVEFHGDPSGGHGVFPQLRVLSSSRNI
jgi:hypothetical protein